MFNYNTWKNGEKLAAEYLKKQGYKILHTNAKLAGAEVDIVAIKPRKLVIKQLRQQYKTGKLLKSSYISQKQECQDILVFVEVKARATNKFGNPEEAVTKSKQMQIKKFAKTFIKNQKYADMPVCFDVISVLDGVIKHIQNAF